jgi:PPOX class probable F420-dependent enzyme
MDRDDARARFAAGRVARLATLAPRRQPQLLPVAFAMGSGPEGDAITFAVDGKARSTSGLRRLQQLAANASVSLLVDHYEDDWSALWWVRADGEARVLEGGPTFRVAQSGLTAKYAAYDLAPPPGPLVVVDVKSWEWWEASDGSYPV